MADNKEIGRIGQRRYGGVIYEEFLHELRGKRGIEAYREMSENDDVVGAILFAIEMLVRQTDWNVEPGGDSQADIDAAEFVESCMNDMQSTWIDPHIRMELSRDCVQTKNGEDKGQQNTKQIR